MKVNGMPSANFDVEYGSPMEGKQDAMNLLSDSGFAFLGCICVWILLSHLTYCIRPRINVYISYLKQYPFHIAPNMWPPHGATWAYLRLILLSILNAKFENFLVVIGLVCSSFVCVSQGTHNRSPWFPYGLDHYDFVRIGNELTSRTFGTPGAWK